MKRAITVLALACLPLAAQTPKLEPKALEALAVRPAATAPKLVPKTPGPVVEKKRTYTYAAKGQSKAARVITMSDGSTVESPLVEIPLRFAKDSTALADEQSRANLAVLADHLKQMGGGTKICVEGHASAEGDSGRNQVLSEQRAKAVRDELILRGVSDRILAPPAGRGSLDATQPAGAAEALLAADRRVLVVREQ